jgi:hypothetical protein
VQLTRNFNFSEFWDVAKAGRAPGVHDHVKVQQLCTTLLQPCRDMFGAITITSGMRGTEHNQKIGGSPTSEHTFNGLTAACDFRVEQYKGDPKGRLAVVRFILDKLQYSYGQLIFYEGTNHIHVSIPTNKHQSELMVKRITGIYEHIPTSDIHTAMRLISEIIR